MFEFLTQHQSWAAIVVYWILSAAVSSMPDPATIAHPGYLWLYRFLHTVAGNVTTVFGSRIPAVTKIAPVVVLLLLLTLSSCVPHYSIHPGALNRTDSSAYDALLIAEAIIDQARLDDKVSRVQLNTLIKSYNVARESWLTYRGALATNAPAGIYFAQLTKNIADLTDAIRAFREVQ